MRRQTSPVAAALCLFVAAASAPAQTQPAAKPAAKETPARKAAAAADPLAAGRRQTATNLLNSLADEARGFRDPTLRSRVQAQAADALWEADAERARALFRRAWDAAEQADVENTRRRQAEDNLPRTGAPGGGRSQQTVEDVRGGGGRPGGLATALNLPQMRSEVLRLAARRDRALGEEFLTKLEDARRQDERTLAADSVAAGAGGGGATGGGASAGNSPGANSTPAPARDPHETPPDDARRLRLASQLLQEGDAERAMQFADPALRRGVNQSVVEFLVNLREKSPEAADERFLALLARASVDPVTNANAVLLLSSYVLTPHMYMMIEPGGGLSTSQRRGDIRAPDLPAPMRAAFANFAAQILTRPLPAADQDPRGAAGRAAVYFVTGLLLPFVEQVAPQRAAAMRTALAAITPDVPQEMREEMQDDMRRGFVPEGQRADERLQQALDAASTSTDPRRRDSAYLQAALIAARREDAKARDYAAKIEDAALRQQAQRFVEFTFVNLAIRKQDGAEVLRLAQAGDLTQTHRAWALTEAARLLLKDDRPRALEALEAAFEAARRIDAEDADRPRALVAVATRYAAVDRARAWELLAEAIKAANASPEFTGADAGLAARVETGSMRSTTNFPAPSFDLDGVFAALAREDMNRAVALAQTFTHEGPRAVATLAVARAVLEDRPAATPNRAATR